MGVAALESKPSCKGPECCSKKDAKGAAARRVLSDPQLQSLLPQLQSGPKSAVRASPVLAVQEPPLESQVGGMVAAGQKSAAGLPPNIVSPVSVLQERLQQY